MPVSRDITTGRIVTENPAALAVFERYGIDYWCGGNTPLAHACAAKGVDAERVVGEIEAERDRSDDGDRRWDRVSPTDLIDHILAAHHRPLSVELRRLHGLTHRVCTAHASDTPALEEVYTIFREFEVEMERHLATEEQRVFLPIREGRPADALPAIAAMEREHDEADAALRRMRALTGGFKAPANADDEWCSLYAGLSELEATLHEHMHLENNILAAHVSDA